MAVGDKELVRVESGDSADDDPRLDWMWWDVEPPSKDFGLSLPVGPFPNGGLFAGGRLSACRK